MNWVHFVYLQFHLLQIVFKNLIFFVYYSFVCFFTYVRMSIVSRLLLNENVCPYENVNVASDKNTIPMNFDTIILQRGTVNKNISVDQLPSAVQLTTKSQIKENTWLHLHRKNKNLLPHCASAVRRGSFIKIGGNRQFIYL